MSEKKEAVGPITAYDVKSKTKNVPMLDAVITRTAKGAYMAQGFSAEGHKLTTLLGQEKAFAAIRAGHAKQGWEGAAVAQAEDEHLHATSEDDNDGPEELNESSAWKKPASEE